LVTQIVFFSFSRFFFGRRGYIHSKERGHEKVPPGRKHTLTNRERNREKKDAKEKSEGGLLPPAGI